MTRMEFDSLKVVTESLEGKRNVDEDTFASVAILSDKLERLRKISKKYCAVEFSPYVKNIMAKEKVMAIS
jgi:hypothetical protein